MSAPPSVQTSAYAKQLLADRNRQNVALRTPPKSVQPSPPTQSYRPPQPRSEVPEIRQSQPPTLPQSKPIIGPVKANISTVAIGSVSTPQIQTTVKPTVRMSSVPPKIYDRSTGVQIQPSPKIHTMVKQPISPQIQTKEYHTVNPLKPSTPEVFKATISDKNYKGDTKDMPWVRYDAVGRINAPDDNGLIHGKPVVTTYKDSQNDMKYATSVEIPLGNLEQINFKERLAGGNSESSVMAPNGQPFAKPLNVNRFVTPEVNAPILPIDPVTKFAGDVVKGAGMAFNSMDPRPIFDSEIAASKPKLAGSNALVDSWIKGTIRGDVGPAISETVKRAQNNPGRIVGEVAANAGVFIATTGVGNALGTAAANIVRAGKDVVGSATTLKTSTAPAKIKINRSSEILNRNIANAKASGVNVERLPSSSKAIASRKFMSDTPGGIGRSAKGDEDIATALGEVPDTKVLFTGTRTPSDIKRMSEFSKFISEKHRGRTYPRGTIGTSYDPNLASRLKAVGVASAAGAATLGTIKTADALPMAGRSRVTVKTTQRQIGIPFYPQIVKAPQPQTYAKPEPPIRKKAVKEYPVELGGDADGGSSITGGIGVTKLSRRDSEAYVRQNQPYAIFQFGYPPVPPAKKTTRRRALK